MYSLVLLNSILIINVLVWQMVIILRITLDTLTMQLIFKGIMIVIVRITNMLTIHPWIIKYYFDEVHKLTLSLVKKLLILVNAERANNFAYVKVIHGTKTNNINYCE
ncbi:hypothetical protein ACJX0J_029026 [Zea mays]